MILEEETYKKFGYYPSELSRRSGRLILVTCDDCGKIRETTKDRYSMYCRSCSHKGERNAMYGISMNGENNPNWKGGEINQICKTCGKEFEVKRSLVKKGGGKYCSIRCASIIYSKRFSGRNSPSWKGGRSKQFCSMCGNSFYAKRDQIKKGWGKYCSRSCASKAQRYKTKPEKTQPERIFENICKKYILPFRFIGDGSLWRGNANPDFIHKTRKLCVEVFGDYWHSPLLNGDIRYIHTVEGRRKQLKAEGYKLIVIWESDLKRKDAEAFVLNTLQKEKIIKKSIEKAI